MQIHLLNIKKIQGDGSKEMTYQVHLFIEMTIGFIGSLFCIFLYQSNKVKQAQIYLFLTVAMMAFWMYVATGYLL